MRFMFIPGLLKKRVRLSLIGFRMPDISSYEASYLSRYPPGYKTVN